MQLSSSTTELDFYSSRYTGKERDTESGNDYFGARYYASSMGRFSSPDPSGLFYADPTNPQSFNLYSYVLNNPLRNIDPSGEECVWDDGSFDSADDKDSGSADKCSGLGGTWVPPNLFENAALTNGQWKSNYGDWSGQANSNLAQNWTAPSSSTNAPDNSPITLNIPLDVWIWAAQQTTPTRGPWTYGNWAGPGGMGAPIDNADAGAMMHDYCYAHAPGGPLTAGSNFGGNNGALQACNQALCDTEGKVSDQVDRQMQNMPMSSPDWGPLNDMRKAAGQIDDYFHSIPFNGNGCRAY